ncbi:MAG: preprotein translocase subunit YajC [Desulfatirhabdiaceae bacterium]
MVSLAYAMGQGGAASPGSAGGIASFIPLILMFVIFYFLLIRPQQKKTKELREMVAGLKKGDRIITSGGIHGQITAVEEATVTVEISDKVRVKLNRGNVAGVVQNPSQIQQKKTPAEADKAK